MNTTIPIDMVIDDLAAKAGGYVSFPEALIFVLALLVRL